MKKLSILLIGLLLISGFVFAQDEDVVAAVEDLESRVAALEGATAITATGSISFMFGADLNDDTPNLPVFTSTKAATATLSLGTSDEKVSATIGVNLLALPSVATTLSGADDPNLTGEVAFDDEDNVYEEWGYITAFIDWYNAANEDDEDVDAELFDILSADVFAFAGAFDANGPYAGDDFAAGAAFDMTLLSQVIAEALSAVDGTTYYSLVDEIGTDAGDDLDDIVLKSLDVDGVPAELDDDEFTFLGVGDGDGTDDPGDFYYDAVQNAWTTIQTYIDQQFAANIQDYLAGLLVDSVNAADDDFAEAYLGTVTDVTDYITDLQGVNLTEYEQLGTDDREYLKDVADIALEYANIDNSLIELGVSTKVTSNAITSATFKVMGVGGLVDLTANMAGSNLGVGAGINLDGAGHSSTAVKTYPSLTIGLTSGVVEGATAALTIYSDNNGAKNQIEVTDSWYTLLDESAGNADPVEPALGLKADLGYTVALSDDMSVGATAVVGMYDVLGGDDSEFGFSVSVPFSGFGANASVLYGMGLGMMHAYVSADYTIMGITPTVGFRYAAVSDDYVIGYVKDGLYNSGTAAVLGEGGIEVLGSAAVDLSEFLPFAASVNGGATYSMPTDDDAVLAWNAGLSVTPIDIVTLTAAAAAKGIERGDAAINPLTWSVGASATVLEGLTATASIGQAWAAATASYAGVGYLAPAAGLSYTFGAATLSANYSTAYELKDSEAYGKYSLGMSVKF